MEIPDSFSRLSPSLSLSLSKCWQGEQPFLCFQAQITQQDFEGSGPKRHKGYLLVDARPGHSALSWLTEKPEDLKPGGGAAALLRSQFSSAIVISAQMQEKSVDVKTGFLALTVLSSTASSGNKDIWSAQRVIFVSEATPPQLELLASEKQTGEVSSLLRWSEKGLYTVRKRSPEAPVQLLESFSKITGQRSSPPTETGGSELLTFLIESWLGVNHPSTNLKSSDTESGPSSDALPLFQREARDRVARRLKTLHKTLKQDSSKIPTTAVVVKAKQEAKLLQNWMNLVEPEQFELRLKPEQTGLEADIVISLDPERPAGDQLNERFHKLKRLEKALELGGKRIDQLQKQIDSLTGILQELKGPSPKSAAETERLLALAGLAAQHSKNKTNPRDTSSTVAQAKRTGSVVGRIFESSDGALMQVGRTAQENDLITKAAKSNDWWVHTTGGVQGAHVVIAKRSLKGNPPEIPAATLREAGILAVHFSGLALSRQGEVYVTTRGELRKRKGMADGLWLVQRTKTVMVRYEEADLKAVFARERRSGTLRSVVPL